MKKIKNYERETKKLYDEIDQIWPDNNSWYDYTHSKIVNFISNNSNIFFENDKILNAGSGGSIYADVKGEFYHVDISNKFIKNLPNHFIASIENLPFKSNFFDSVICVGSVINYCNALTAIAEIYRTLKSNSYLILEYERSHTGELIFKHGYGQSAILQIYEYNNQNNHKLWLYSDVYINNILSSVGFKIIKSEYYHVISSLLNRFLKNETKAGIFSKYDNQIPSCLQKRLAHNRLLLCYKE